MTTETTYNSRFILRYIANVYTEKQCHFMTSILNFVFITVESSRTKLDEDDDTPLVSRKVIKVDFNLFMSDDVSFSIQFI